MAPPIPNDYREKLEIFILCNIMGCIDTDEPTTKASEHIWLEFSLDE